MKKLFVSIGLVLGNMLFFMPTTTQAQTYLILNNFTNWQVYTGNCLNGVDTIYPSQPIPGRHTILYWSQMDSLHVQDKYCDIIDKDSWQIPHFAKLGNDTANAKIDALEYTMLIDSNNSLLTVHFAYVLENPQEQNPNERPKFTIQIRDSLGNPLNLDCSNLEFIADTGLQNAACTGNIVARDWTTVGFNLEPLIGQTIRIYFEVRDGSQGNHFGYAYIAAECRPARMTLEHCANGVWDASLRAPSGFAYYKWTKSSNSSWVLEGENRYYTSFMGVADGDVFTCVMTSGLDTNCTTTLTAKFVYTILNADFVLIQYDTCSQTATFADLSTVINSGKDEILWEIPQLNLSSMDSLFTYTFPNPEDDNPVNYLVRLSVSATNICSHTYDGKWKKEQYITIYPSPKVEIDGVDQICTGDTAFFKAIPIRHTFIHHTWSWEDTNGVIQTSTGDSVAIYTPGIYYLASQDSNGCIARDTFTVTALKLLINVTITDVNCYGESTGKLTHGVITDGTDGFQWIKWNLGDTVIDGSVTGAIYSDLVAGIYTVEALDSLNCLLSAEFEIKQNDSLRITASQQATTSANTGTLKLWATGGVPPYLFEIRKEDNTFISSSDTAWNLSAGLYLIQVTDAVDCVTSDTISVSLEVGISNLKNDNFMVIYPNPVLDGKLRIEVSDFAVKEGDQIIITDITGKTVLVSEFSSKRELDVSSLASGIYIIQIGSIREKFIK